MALALPVSLAGAALARAGRAQSEARTQAQTQAEAKPLAQRQARTSPRAPRTITDDRGATLTFDDVPRRIATISYFGADTALALGVRPIASTFLARARRPSYLRGQLDDVLDIGQRASPNLELLARARPDMIVAMRRYTEANARKLAQIGPYVALDLETLDDGRRGIALVGAALDRAGVAARINERFAALLNDYGARVAKRSAPPPRYAFVWGAGGAPWAYYDESATCTLLNRLGGVNVAGRNPWPERRENTAFQMSLEALLRAAPDTVFVYDDGPPHAFEANAAWRYLIAHRRTRVVRVDDHWIESCGPIARHAVLAEAAAHLYPATFAQPDLRAIVSSYLRS
ncbi:MAG TPA: ABC transporter substrate-binding protein [Trinickia sp.]|nr:ABC transporter substrate-binding protein [Trinickia sp.]